MAPQTLLINVTADVGMTPPLKRSDAELIIAIVHEAVHAMDPHKDSSTLERYKREFRAYWVHGDYGPPDKGTCPPSSTAFTTPCAPTGSSLIPARFTSALAGETVSAMA